MSVTSSGENSAGIGETPHHEENSREPCRSKTAISGIPVPESHDRVQPERRKGHQVISTATYFRAERRGSGGVGYGGSYVPTDVEADAGDGMHDE